MNQDFNNDLNTESSEGNEDDSPGGATGRSLADELGEIALRCSRRQLLDPRSEDEILGYGPDGVPG